MDSHHKDGIAYLVHVYGGRGVLDTTSLRFVCQKQSLEPTSQAYAKTELDSDGETNESRNVRRKRIPGSSVLKPDFHLSRPQVELLGQSELLLL